MDSSCLNINQEFSGQVQFLFIYIYLLALKFLKMSCNPTSKYCGLWGPGFESASGSSGSDIGSHSSGSLTLPRCKIGTRSWPGNSEVDFEDHYVQARAEFRQWWIHSGFDTHGQSQPKSETECTSGSTKWWLITAKNYQTSLCTFCFHGWEPDKTTAAE